MTDFLSKLQLDEKSLTLFQIREELEGTVNLLILKLDADTIQFESRHSDFYKQYEQVSEELLPIIERTLNQSKRILFTRINFIVEKLQDMKSTLENIQPDNEMISDIDSIIKSLRQKEDHLLNNR